MAQATERQTFHVNTLTLDKMCMSERTGEGCLSLAEVRGRRDGGESEDGEETHGDDCEV